MSSPKSHRKLRILIRAYSFHFPKKCISFCPTHSIFTNDPTSTFNPLITEIILNFWECQYHQFRTHPRERDRRILRKPSLASWRVLSMRL
eukprot:UN18686